MYVISVKPDRQSRSSNRIPTLWRSTKQSVIHLQHLQPREVVEGVMRDVLDVVVPQEQVVYLRHAAERFALQRVYPIAS